MAPSQKRAVATISWRLALVGVLAKAAWDAVGLLAGGSHVYASHSYDLLRLMPGGMRTYGVALAVLLCGTLLALSERVTNTSALRWCLALLACWYVGWMLGVVGAWARHAPIAWGAVSSLAVISFFTILVARATPVGRGR